MQHYIVLFPDKQPSPKPRSQAGKPGAPPAVSRGELYSAGISRATELQQSLESWLRKEGVPKTDYMFAEPTAFPLLLMTATPRVAELVAKFPGVESVTQDQDDLRFIR